MMKNGPLSVKGPSIGGMKMVKYVHCTVVETRVCGRVQSEKTETLDSKPYPQPGIPNNAYQMRPNCDHKPTAIDYRA